MLNCLRKECIRCCIDSGNFRSCWSKLNSCYQLQLGIHLRLENIWYEIQYGEVKLTNHCMLNCLRKECIHCCIDSENFRSCWCIVESSCYQLQIGIHLRLENRWYEIQYGEVKLTNHCMLSCLRKECIRCCTDSGNFHLCWCKWEQLLSVAIGIHLRLKYLIWNTVWGGKLTNHCMLSCLRKECNCCIDSGNFRLCWCKVESSCYQLQLGIHLRLENLIWNTVWGGEINQPLHVELSEERMYPLLHWQWKLPFMLMHSWDTVVISWNRHSFTSGKFDMKYSMGKSILTNHCMLNFVWGKNVSTVAMTVETSVCVDASWDSC